jgi:tRNA G26 N,N-dimethylase Trm1
MEARRIACTRIGGPLWFGPLWEQLGIAEVLGELLANRGFEFAVEHAVFASVLHRLMEFLYRRRFHYSKTGCWLT